MEYAEYAQAVAEHQSTPEPKIADPEARLVVAAALVCQATLNPDPEARNNAVDLLMTDYAGAAESLKAADEPQPISVQ